MATQKFQLLLVDANIVIKLHELGIWGEFIQRCSVTLTGTVAYHEVKRWADEQKIEHRINLQDDIVSGRICCEEVSLAEVAEFHRQFDPSYLDRLDPGESEILAMIWRSEKEWLAVSSDGIVFKVLGRLGRGQQGISLEEILQKIGLGRRLDGQYTKEFRGRLTQMGQEDSIRGRGTI